MAYEQKPGQGILFVNDKKGNDKAPDRKGTVNIGGETYDIAGWLKEGQKGPFLSLKVSKKGERKEQRHEPEHNDEDQQIPF